MAKVDFRGGNTSNYSIGRGRALYEEVNSAGVGLGAYRDLGNVTAFSIETTTETLPHQSSQEGLQTTDLEVTTSQTMSVTLTLDEISQNNLALFFQGVLFGSEATGNLPAAAIENAAAAASDGAVVTSANENFVKTGVFPDLWYPIELVISGNNVRAYDFEQNQITEVKKNATGRDETTGTALAEKTAAVPNGDYELDRKKGMIRFNTTGANKISSLGLDSILVSWSAPAVSKGSVVGADETLSRIDMLTSSGVARNLIFIGENPADGDHPDEIHLYQVNLRPDGAYEAIGDDFQNITLTGSVEKVDPPPYGTSGFGKRVTRANYST